jgi:threonine dehydrogenase-like Zn-dependent dehydrogenase
MGMKALLLTDSGPKLESAYPCPVPQSGEALIRVALVGICATDLALIAGYKGGYRGVLGHEFVGEVVAAPDAPEWVGRRVVGEINIGCGNCSLCKQGLGKHCRQRTSLGIIAKDGALAEMLTLPVANLHVVPPSLSDEEAVFVEPLAASLEILEQLHIAPERRVYVIGSGRLGMLIAQVLALTGCDLTVVGRHEQSLAMLRQWHHCKTVLTSPQQMAILADEPADVVVEVTGSAEGFENARELVRPGGRLC